MPVEKEMSITHVDNGMMANSTLVWNDGVDPKWSRIILHVDKLIDRVLAIDETILRPKIRSANYRIIIRHVKLIRRREVQGRDCRSRP
jgi:hypothetical protein